MQLYFVRHGQSQNNLLWELHGHELGRSDDPDLTERGLQQAQAVAELIATGHPQHHCQSNPGGFGIRVEVPGPVRSAVGRNRSQRTTNCYAHRGYEVRSG